MMRPCPRCGKFMVYEPETAARTNRWAESWHCDDSCRVRVEVRYGDRMGGQDDETVISVLI